MLRDVLVSEVPAVLRGELYASAALAGAISGAVLCFVLRFLAIRRGWRLPVAGHPMRRATDERADRGSLGGSGRLD